MAEDKTIDLYQECDSQNKDESNLNEILRDAVTGSKDAEPNCVTGSKDAEPNCGKDKWVPVCELDSDRNFSSCLNYTSDKLRRSKSDDIITPSKTHREKCNNFAENQSGISNTTKSSQPESDSSTEEDDGNDFNFRFASFFDEYEKRVENIEYCDFILEDSILHLQTKITEIEDLFNAFENERQKAIGKDEPGNGKRKEDDEHCNGEERVDDKVEEHVESKEKEEEEMLGTINEIQMMFLTGLRYSLEELQKKFEKFVVEVGETIQLGALAAKYSMRLEDWANHIQQLYLVVKEDQVNIRNYLTQKENEWLQIKKHYDAELKGVTGEMEDALRCLKKVDGLKTTDDSNPEKEGTQHSRKPDDPDVNTAEETLMKMLQKKNYDQQQVIALDLCRQMKISELKLVVLRQQGYIQMLELQNKELVGILRGLPDRDKPEDATPDVLNKSLPVTGEINTLSKVLNCDKGMYLPGETTHPELVALQTFNAGEGCLPLPTDNKEIFDPRVLNYIQHDNESEMKDTHNEVDRAENQATKQLQGNESESHANDEVTDKEKERLLPESETLGDVGVVDKGAHLSGGEPTNTLNENVQSAQELS